MTQFPVLSTPLCWRSVLLMVRPWNSGWQARSLQPCACSCSPSAVTGEAVKRSRGCLGPSLGGDFLGSLASHVWTKCPCADPSIPPSHPPSLHPPIIQQAPSKVCEVLGTRKHRSNSSPGSVLRERMSSQPCPHTCKALREGQALAELNSGK